MLGNEASRRLLAVLAVLFVATTPVLDAQAPLGSPAKAAPQTESLTFNVEWRLINAGTANVQRSQNQMVMRLQSAGLVSKLYKVDDTYTVTHDGGCATSLHLIANEGRRKRDTKVTFDRTRNRADYLERDLIKNNIVRQDSIEIPNCVYDVVGALHALRGMRIDPGKSIDIAVSDGKKFAAVRVEAQEREDVKIKGKPVKTVRYEAFLFNNVIYSRKARMLLWLTDDARRVPVKLQVRMSFPIGTITLTLDKEEVI